MWNKKKHAKLVEMQNTEFLKLYLYLVFFYLFIYFFKNVFTRLQFCAYVEDYWGTINGFPSTITSEQPVVSRPVLCVSVLLGQSGNHV